MFFTKQITSPSSEGKDKTVELNAKLNFLCAPVHDDYAVPRVHTVKMWSHARGVGSVQGGDQKFRCAQPLSECNYNAH